MKTKRSLVFSVAYLLLGAGLIAATKLASLDSVWLGMGGGLCAVGLIQLVSSLRYAHDESYREKVDTESGDERNRFLRLRAWAWAGYTFVLIAAAATIVFMILGRQTLMTASSCGVCLIMVAHWISYWILSKKY